MAHLLGRGRCEGRLAQGRIKRPRHSFVEDLHQAESSLSHRDALVQVDQSLGEGPLFNRGRAEQASGRHIHGDGIGDGHHSAVEFQLVGDVHRLGDVNGVSLDGHIQCLIEKLIILIFLFLHLISFKVPFLFTSVVDVIKLFWKKSRFPIN